MRISPIYQNNNNKPRFKALKSIKYGTENLKNAKVISDFKRNKAFEKIFEKYDISVEFPQKTQSREYVIPFDKVNHLAYVYKLRGDDYTGMGLHLFVHDGQEQKPLDIVIGAHEVGTITAKKLNERIAEAGVEAILERLDKSKEFQVPNYSIISELRRKRIEERNSVLNLSINDQKEAMVLLNEIAKLYDFDAGYLQEIYNKRGNAINEPLNFNNSRLIHYAAMNEKSDFLKLLLKHPDININVVDSQGKTPLHYAYSREQVDNIKLLLERKDIDKDIKDNYGSIAEQCAFGLSEDFYQKYRRNGFKKFW